MPTDKEEFRSIEEHMKAARLYLDRGGPRPLFRFELRLIARRALKLWWRTRGNGDNL